MKKYLLVTLFLLSSLISGAQGWQKVKRTLASGAVQRGWSRRDLSVYPQTSLGNAAFYAGVNAGLIPIVFTDPINGLPTSQTGLVGPGWGSARYSLSGGSLKIEATSDVQMLKVERNDGTLMNGTSPDVGGTLTGGVFYYFAPQSSTDFVKVLSASWSPGVAAQSLKLTFKRSNGDLYSQNLTPVVTTSPVALFTAPGSTTTSPGSTTALSFVIVSYNCTTGVLTYKFTSSSSASITVSIPGITNQPATPGTVYSFTFPSDARIGATRNVSASQNGTQISTYFVTSCSLGPTTTDPPSTTVTDPGSGNYTPTAFDWSEPAGNTPVTPGLMKVLENDHIRVIQAISQQWTNTTAPGLSGEVFKAYDKHDPAWSPTSLTGVTTFKAPYTDQRINTGANLGTSTYRNPRPFTYLGATDAGYTGGPLRDGNGNISAGTGLGVNDLLGDDGGYTGEVLKYVDISATKSYVKTRPVLYSNIGLKDPAATFEHWREVIDRGSYGVLDVHLKYTINNSGQYRLPDNSGAFPVQMRLNNLLQEMPCGYFNPSDGTKPDGNLDGNGRTKVVFYDGNAPYTNAQDLTRINLYLPNPGPRNYQQHVTEPWIAVVDDSNRGYGLILQYPSVQINLLGPGDHHRDHSGNNDLTVYLAQYPGVMLDDHIVHYSNYKIVWGTLDQIRAEGTRAENRLASSPSFAFNVPDRLGWTYEAYNDDSGERTKDDGVNAIGANGYWNVKFLGSAYGSISSPFFAYSASANKKLYIKMAYTGPRSTWAMSWSRARQKPGQDPITDEEWKRWPEGKASDTQFTRFSVIGDGQTRVYTIDLSSHPEWIKTITDLRFNPNADGNISSESSAKIYWISTSPDGPTKPNGPLQNGINPLSLLLLAGGLRRTRKPLGVRQTKPTKSLIPRIMKPILSALFLLFALAGFAQQPVAGQKALSVQGDTLVYSCKTVPIGGRQTAQLCAWQLKNPQSPREILLAEPTLDSLNARLVRIRLLPKR